MNFPDKKERIQRGTEDWGGLLGPKELPYKRRENPGAQEAIVADEI
jgi:hypothetical protein